MSTCKHCGTRIERYTLGPDGWVDTTVGGSYDFCPDAPGPDWDFEKKHHPTKEG